MGNNLGAKKTFPTLNEPEIHQKVIPELEEMLQKGWVKIFSTQNQEDFSEVQDKDEMHAVVHDYLKWQPPNKKWVTQWWYAATDAGTHVYMKQGLREANP